MKRILTTLLVLSMMLTLVACGGGTNKAETAAAGAGAGSDDGMSHAKLILVLEDETEVPYDIAYTPESNLRDALLEAGLITEETYGELFIKTIDQYTADWESEDAPRAWEVRDEEDNAIQGFFEEIIVEDGATYRIVNVEVPFFDD